ncbi:MAG: M23 family metallopeptidase [Burkholderiales bacterium]|nr:M23 family metallopeptidase [Burkholderiales bacterium]
MRQRIKAILAQLLRAPIARTGARRIVAFLVLPFVGIVAAFGIAPDTTTDTIPRRQVLEELELPALSVALPDDARFWREERVRRDDTLGAVLSRLGVEDPDAFRQLRAERGARGIYQLAPGRTVRAQTNAEGKLFSLGYVSAGTAILVERNGETFSVRREPVALERRIQMGSGEIRSSLFAATDAANLADAVAIQIADIFSTDIDFHRDLRKGDRFSVLYEAFYDRGELVRTGRVLAAEFINNHKVYQGVWFQHGGEPGGYYTLEGRNIRKAFLRSPLEFTRISSGFTNARFHPVLQTWRAHRGIDYAAATGTRVRATGDGVVEFAGRQGGYGNLVVLRHQSQYTTWYGHLSGIARGLRKGSRVAQGEVIGYVGATGLASGPHLHYEFRIHNVHQNPLRVALPSAPPITDDRRPAFETATQPLGAHLALLRGTNLARLD